MFVEEEGKKTNLVKKYWVFLIPILVVGALFVLVRSTKPSPTPQVGGVETQNMETELKIEDIKVGTGKEAVAGKTIAVHYTGTLENGAKFDSSVDRGQPFTFSLGAGDVIEGWDKGIVGMKEGGKRKLTIPPSMGYGNQAVGEIPANSTLIFEVDLLKVE